MRFFIARWMIAIGVAMLPEGPRKIVHDALLYIAPGRMIDAELRAFERDAAALRRFG